MDENEKLVMLKTMVESTDSNEVLLTYLKIAGKKIIAKAFPFNTTITEVPVQYDVLQCEIAAYMLNKRGAEGQLMHSENGITRQYETADVPSSLLKTITPFVGTIK